MYKTQSFSPNTAQKVRVGCRVWELSARVLTWHLKTLGDSLHYKSWR